MTRDQDFERHLGDWLAEGPVTAPAKVVDDAIERTSERRQRHRLLPRLGWLTELSWEMRDGPVPALPLATVMTLAVLVLTAAMLTLRPFGPVSGGPPAMDGSAARGVSGTVETIGAIASDEAAERVLRIETTDERVRGEAHQILRTERATDGRLERSSGVMRLENDWGAWEGVVSSVRYPDDTAIEYGWLTGEGAYEGYSYFHLIHDRHAETERVFEGAIWPGEPPPIPHPSRLQADPLD